MPVPAADADAARSRSRSIVQAAIDTGPLDRARRLHRRRDPRAGRRHRGDRPRRRARPPRRFAINFTPASLLDPRLRGQGVRGDGPGGRPVAAQITRRVHGAAGGRPTSARSSGRSRPCAGSASGSRSTTRAPATRASRSSPPCGRRSSRSTARSSTASRHDDAKQALVEAFVSFGRRIGAKLVAEGIENRADLAMLRDPRGRLRPGLPARQAGDRSRPAARVSGRPMRQAATAPALAYHRGRDPSPRPSPSRTRVRRRSSRERPPLRDHRHDRSRRRPTPGRHLVHARRRRPRHQQRRRAPLAGEPACATRGSRVAVTDAGGRLPLGRADRRRSRRSRTSRPRRPTSPAMARRYHADEPDEAERLIRDRFERQERISFRVHAVAVHDHLE